jgi:hypothetical protein
MKKVLIVAAAAGLMSLTACETTPAANNTAANVAEVLENDGEMLENEVVNTTDEAMLGNEAENVAE